LRDSFEQTCRIPNSHDSRWYGTCNNRSGADRSFAANVLHNDCRRPDPTICSNSNFSELLLIGAQDSVINIPRMLVATCQYLNVTSNLRSLANFTRAHHAIRSNVNALANSCGALRKKAAK
jgi:hypothetical protein